MICFELTMPNVGSWNGKWTGQESKYYLIKKVSKIKEAELHKKSFYYNFGDGWGASIKAEVIDSKEFAKRKRISKGFCGYSWMVDEILEYGRILTLNERDKLKNELLHKS